MLPTIARSESGQAAVLEAVIALLAVFALALPLFEYGRMTNDSILAASAFEDVAKMVAANPATTTSDVDEMLQANYEGIAPAAAAEVHLTPLKKQGYYHKLNVEGGAHVTRPSKVSWREVEVRITVKRDFITAAGVFIGAVSGSTGYTISKEAVAVIDQTISSEAW